MSITNFKIITLTTGDSETLQTKVNQAIADGWQPHGPLVVAHMLLHQPMVKGTADGGGGGGLSQAGAVPDSTASDVAGVVVDFNGLLASLRTAGLVATA